ncbi:MAG: bifunctional adenosylcobinamide kinase/adenosylcobinamide-phosphate guanylyltransferase [Actinomycetota bacterium]
MSLLVLLGGARSGKSSYAVDLGRRLGGPVTYVATAPSLDDDMAQRIARHRNERPAEWTTVEEQADLSAALDGIPNDHAVIIDCLTLWTSNMLWQEHTEPSILDTAHVTSERCATRARPVIAISNEVGLGVHPETDLGRTYRDLLGRVNQVWTRRADVALMMVAGRALRLETPDGLLGTMRNDLDLP